MRLLKIIPFYGAWPVYMHLYLESCRRNPMLHVVFVLWILVLYVTMVYGPIAAMLVELFSTRIRYTSMSLP